MLELRIQFIKFSLVVLFLTQVKSWSPQCSPCRCFLPKIGKPVKTSDCSSFVTLVKLTKIPNINIDSENIILVGQQLETIPENAFFSGRPNGLKFLSLKNSQVRLIHVNAFTNLNELSGLDLSNNNLNQVDENVFRSNTKLKVLILQNNNFQVFPEKLFNNFLNLEYLDLSDNKLHYIHPNQFKNNVNLKRLILQSNQLSRIDIHLILNLPKLNVLYLDNNPWSCNCQIKDIQKLIIDRNIDFLYDNKHPVCIKPDKWKGKKWLDVKPRELCTEMGPPVNNATEGEDFTVKCHITSSVVLPVQWLHNGQIIDTNNEKKYEILFEKKSSFLILYSLNIRNVKLEDKGDYKCWTNTLKDSDIKFDESSLIVNPGTVPSLEDFHNVNTIVKSGTPIFTLPCKVNGTPEPIVEWSKNGHLIKTNAIIDCQYSINAQSDISGKWYNLTFRNVDPNCEGNYKCHARNIKGSQEKDYIIKVLPLHPPEVSNNVGDNNIVDESSSVKFNCFVSDSINVNAEWLYNGEVLSLNTNNKYSIKVERINPTNYNYVLIINDISVNEAGNYKCRANSQESYPYDLVVRPGVHPVIENFENNDLIVESGTEETTIPCKVKGIPKPDISWTLPTVNTCKYFISPELNGWINLTFTDINPSCMGTYKCIAKNVKGTVEKEVKISVVSLEPPEVDTESNSVDKEITEDSEVILKCLIRGSITSEPQWKHEGKTIEFNNKYKLNKIQITSTSYWFNLIITDLKLKDKGNYKCTIGNFENSINLEVNPSIHPTIGYISNPEPIVEVGTKNVTFACKVTGVPRPSTVWISPNPDCKFEINSDLNGRNEWIYITIFEITPSCAGRYKCVAQNSKGIEEKEINLLVVSMESPPRIELDSNSIDNSVIENDDVTIKCFIQGSIHQPEWLHENKVINFDENSKYKIVKIPVSLTSYWYNLIISNISATDRGNYKCRVNNFENTVSLDVQPNVKPIIEYISNSNSVLEEGEKDVTFVCKGRGIPKPNIFWIHEGRKVDNSLPKLDCKYSVTSKTDGYIEWLYLTIPHVETACAGKYKCVIENSKGFDESEIVLSVVNLQPPEIDVETNTIDNEIIENDNITLQCLIRGSVNSQPKWFYNNKPLGIKNENYKLVILPIDETSYWYNLKISNISPQEHGEYKCRINNLETTIYLNVQPGIKPYIQQIAHPNTIVEEGRQSLTLPCKAVGNPKPKTIWLYENSPLDLSLNTVCKYSLALHDDRNYEWVNLTFKDVHPTCSGKYKCISTSFKGTTKKEVNLEVVRLQAPSIDISTNFTDNQVFENEDATLKCLVPNARYQAEWLRNGEPIIMEPNGRYSITFDPINETAYWYNLEITNLLPNDRGEYKCRINHLESTINLKVQPVSLPIIEYVPNSETVVADGIKDFKLACKVSGIPKPEVNWLFENNNNCKYSVNSEKNGNSEWIYLIIKEVSAACAGLYKCVSKNLVGVDTRDVTLSVIPSEPSEISVKSNSPDGEIRENDFFTLKCLTTGNSKTEWYYNNEPINFRDNRFEFQKQKINSMTSWYILTIKNVTLQDKGRYICRTNNVEKYVDLTVNPALVATVEYLSKSNIIVEENTKLTLPCKVFASENLYVKWIFENEPIESSKCTSISDINYEKTKYFEWYNLTIESISSFCEGRYKCVVNNAKNDHDNVINVNIVPSIPPKIDVTSDSVDKIIREENTVLLKCLVFSKDTNDAKWLYNGQILNSNSKYKITKLIINATSYWYDLEIKNISQHQKGDYKCSSSKSETITTLDVQPGFEPIIEYISNPETIVESGTKDLTLACKVRGIPKSVIVWQFQSVATSIKQSSCSFTTSFEEYKNYEWSYLRIKHVTPNCSGQFRCITRNSKGSTEKTINLTVIPIEKPQISLITTSKGNIIRESDNITLSCLVSGRNSQIKWYVKTQNGKNDNSAYKIKKIEVNPMTYRSDLMITNITLNHIGNYKCWANHLEANIDIFVQPGVEPNIEQISNDLVVESTLKELTIFCKVSGVPAPDVTWFYNDKPIDISQRNRCKYNFININQWKNLTINDVNQFCTGNYKCIVNSFKGSHERDINLIVVNPQRPKISLNSNSTDYIKENEKVTLNCLITGDINSNPEWIFNGKVIKEDENHSIIKQKQDKTSFWYNLEILKASLRDKGNYKCRSNRLEESIHLNIHSLSAPKVESLQNSKIFIHSETKELILPCAITGVPKPTITWVHNNNLIDKISQCPNGCQYKNISELRAGIQFMNLIITNVTLACEGRYKCIAENTVGKNEKSIDVIVIPPEQPEIKINKSPHSALNNDVQLSCEVISVAKPTITWKFHEKSVDFDRNKYLIRDIISSNDVHYSVLTILKFQSSDVGNYSCTANIYQKQKSETVFVKLKTSSKPQFDNPKSLWDNIKIVDGDLTFITKAKGYPPPKLTWSHDNKDIRGNTEVTQNTKYLTEVSQIDDDQYWFNQTIKGFSEVTDSGTHLFIVKNEKGEDLKKFILRTDKSSNTSGQLKIFIDEEEFIPLPSPT